ncbi:MAG TPA: S9 family peptidase [Planctomycetes bacterium]|nr:S9 family peptidase [Planctomycetota bacterium]
MVLTPYFPNVHPLQQGTGRDPGIDPRLGVLPGLASSVRGLHAECYRPRQAASLKCGSTALPSLPPVGFNAAMRWSTHTAVGPRALVPFAVLVAACAGPVPAEAPANGAPAPPDVRPSLKEIFLEPPLSGTPPVIRGLSADGRMLLLAWSPPTPQVRPGPDAEDPRDPRPELRLLDVDEPEASGLEGTPLAELLGRGPEGWSWCEVCLGEGIEGDDAWIRHREQHREKRPGPRAFSPRGARLAVAEGADLFLVEPGEPWRVRHLIAPAVREPKASDAEGEEESTSAKIDALRFAPEDGVLWISADGELHELDLDTLSEAPRALDTLPSPTTAIEAAADTLQWDRSHRVAFSNRDLLRAEEDDEDAEEPEDDAPAARQVFLVEEQRGVSLEGMEDEDSLESARLSPDGSLVFALAFDRDGDPEPTLVPDYLTERVTVRHARRLLADALPAPWRAVLWDTHTGTRRDWIASGLADDGSEGDATDEESPDGKERAAPDTLLERSWTFPIGWAPQPDADSPARFALERRSADFAEREIWIVEADGARRVFAERDPHWIGGPAVHARWSADGTALLVGSENASGSTRSGWCQLFALDPETSELRQLTAFAGELRSFRPLPGGAVLLEASEADPACTEVFLLPAGDVRGAGPSSPRRLPFPAGWNEGSIASRDGTTVVTSHESLFEPAELWALRDGRAQPVTHTVPARFRAAAWIRPQRIAIRSADGRTIYAHVFVPPGVDLADPGPARATIVFVHGAGYLQNVTDSMTRYPLNLMFHSRLARMGYPVVDVDYRGSAGYGRDFRGDVQYHLGGKDLDDIQAVVDHLADIGLVDPERVGIYGGSYGGFMTMMALFTAPERWAVGAALRSVTDWRTYHPFYTQPRLGRPSTHPEAYRRSSPIDLVDGLDDPLLILHGMVDQNVFAQDSIRLIEKLIDRGKEFDAMLYPSQGHGFRDGPHWLDEYTRIERYLTGHLGPAVR